jgi:hypothetical protein
MKQPIRVKLNNRVLTNYAAKPHHKLLLFLEPSKIQNYNFTKKY